jgi:DNA-binding NtrC family response regulator
MAEIGEIGDLRRFRAAGRGPRSRARMTAPLPLGELIGRCKAVEALREQIRRVSRIPTGGRPPSVLLLGETGTGKGLVASLLHRAGVRAGGPFVEINCAAIPETLLEAELFGFERGAFTDARATKRGLFESAHRGTIFLDEIGSLSESLQAKILTAIESQQTRRLGSTRSEAVDAWVIAATSRDLVAAMETGRFRRDLYHRISTVVLNMPPLRERGRDILVLAEHFLARATADYGVPPRRLDAAARKALLSYRWPGNLRELTNVLQRVTILADHPIITAAILAPQLQSNGTSRVERDTTVLRSAEDIRAEDRRELIEALNATRGNISRAAARLGIPRNTMRYRLAKHGIASGDPPANGRSAPGRSERDSPGGLDASLALAKILAPSVRSVVPRPRLFRRLDRAGDHPVTWLTAPAGSGKTSLVASYLAGRGHRHLWYRVDETDEDVATVFYYIGRLAAAQGTALPVFTPEFRRGLATFTRKYFRALYERLETPFALVLDNYQTVSDSALIHDVVRGAAEELPQGGRIIALSREDPPRQVIRLRASRAVDIISWPELRLTPAETVRVIRELAHHRWSAAAIRSVHDAVDGWAAGLILILEHARDRGLTSFVGPSGSQASIFEYFAHEVLSRADVDTRDVLIRTALVPSVTASLAVALTGQRAAEAILEQLHRQQYFTSKQPHAREPIYHYHPLFREFLLAQGRLLLEPEQLGDLRRTAADLVEAAGDADAAFGLLRDATDWPGLADLITRQAPALLAQGRSPTVEGWLASLPAATILERPWLSYWRGICQLAWRDTESRLDLERAFHTFRDQSDAAGMFLAWSALMVTYESEAKLTGTDAWMAVVTDILPDTGVFPSEEVEMRVAGGILIGLIRNPHYPDAPRWAARALELALRHPDLTWRTITAFNWFQYTMQRGDLRLTDRVAEAMRTLMQTPDVSPTVAVCASMTVVWHEWMTGNPSYRDTVSRTIELAYSAGMLFTTRHSTIGAGLFGALSDGDTETIDRWLQELEKELASMGPGYRGWYHQFAMRAALLRGDRASVEHHRTHLLGLVREGGAPLHEVVDLLLSAHAVLSEDHEMARGFFEQADRIAHTFASPYADFMVRITEAEISFTEGRESDGLRALAKGLEIGRAFGYVNSHTWLPAVMTRLCERAIQAGIEPDYVRGLVRRRALPVTRATPTRP